MVEVREIVVKAGKCLINFIRDQLKKAIIDYVTSEEFQEKMKKNISDMVDQMVKLIFRERQ